MSPDPVQRDGKSTVPAELMVLLALVAIAWQGELAVWVFNWFCAPSR